MQETLRQLRDQWKQADQGGPANHALWKKFDEACNAAHKVVEAWLDKVRSDAAEHKAQRLALIEELKTWTREQLPALAGDLKAVNRALHQFGDRWRDGGHVGEKMFAELQPQWKQALAEASAPLEAAKKDSLARRHAMIEEATALGAAPVLRVDAVKALQQRWQAEAQSVPLDRKQEQKLWDAFRKPIDEAFNRKSAERERAAGEMSARDRAVLEASKALEAANASGDAQRIRSAMADLEAALRSQAQGNAEAAAAAAPAQAAPENAAVATESAEAGAAAGGEEAAAPAAARPSPHRGPWSPCAAMTAPACARTSSHPLLLAVALARMAAARTLPGVRAMRPPGGRSLRRGSGWPLRRSGRACGIPWPASGRCRLPRAQRDALEQAQNTLRKLAAQLMAKP